MTTLSSRIAGIPCLIEVISVVVQKPLGRMADSDWDCYGYSDVEFEVQDRRGRKAPWLERKMTQADKARIETEILEYSED